MLKSVTLAIAIGLAAGGVGWAQTVHPPAAAADGKLLFAKHDRNDPEQRGRKLGHRKHQQEVDDEDDNDRRARRSTQRQRSTTAPGWYAPAPYYGAPGYGPSYPPGYYDYAPGPNYYRGY